MIAFGASPCALIPKIIPELSAGRHLLVKFPSRSGFIAVFLLEALDNTTMLFSDSVPYFIVEKMQRVSCALWPLAELGGTGKVGSHSTYCRNTHQLTCGQQWLFLIKLIKDLQLMCCFHCSLHFF